MGVRAQQKERTRQALLDAALKQLSPERSFSNLSLREVAREAGIAPTSFYRHFSSMDDLGLTLVDQAGVTLRQLMRQARERIASGGSVIRTSVECFMEFIEEQSDIFRLLLRERSGTSAAFRAAVAREIRHFVAELSEYLQRETTKTLEEAAIEAEALVMLVFNAGAEALDITDILQKKALTERTIKQLRMIAHGSNSIHAQKMRIRGAAKE